MARDTIFECKEPMPSMTNSPDVVRTALSAADARENRQPAIMQGGEKDVVNVNRPVRGRPY